MILQILFTKIEKYQLRASATLSCEAMDRGWSANRASYEGLAWKMVHWSDEDYKWVEVVGAVKLALDILDEKELIWADAVIWFALDMFGKMELVWCGIRVE